MYIMYKMISLYLENIFNNLEKQSNFPINLYIYIYIDI